MQEKKTEQFNQWIEDLYRLYRERLFHYALRILLSREDAEDAVHATFAWIIEKKKVAGDPNDEAVWHYLSVITRHYALNRIREKRHFDADYSEQIQRDPLEEIEPGPTPLDWAMDQLPERAREMLLLRFADGFSTHEIADLYGMKISAVRQVLLRTKRKLKEILKTQEENP